MTMIKKTLVMMYATLALSMLNVAQAGHHEAGHDNMSPSIVELAAGNDDLSTLVAAVQAAVSGAPRSSITKRSPKIFRTFLRHNTFRTCASETKC